MSSFDIDNPLSVCFINRDNYPDYESALAEGAVYKVPSTIDLFGTSGLADLSEIVSTLLACIGIGSEYTAFVLTEYEGYQPIDVVYNELTESEI